MSTIPPLLQPEYEPLSLRSRQRLVASLKQSGALHTPALEQAFLTIPREAFVPSFYEQEGGGRSMTWKQVTGAQTAPEAYLSAIYLDHPLITQLDERSWPISSSSQPSAMARMLEALDVRPGQHVLEIGTGTGYNAALLAHLTGDPRLVTTIEIDPTLAEQAREVLHPLIGEVQVLVGDGYTLAPSQRYDRIIATASAQGIPRSWYEQLTDGGRIVMPLQGSLHASGFLVIEKGTTRGAGHFLQMPLAFMSMRTAAPTDAPTTRELFQQPITRRMQACPPTLISLLTDADFRWFVQWAWPSSHMLQIVRMKTREGRHLFHLKDPLMRAIVQLKEEANGLWSGQQHGTFPLWEQFLHWSTAYERLGRPEKDAYRLDLDEERACLSVHTVQEQVILRDNLFL